MSQINLFDELVSDQPVATETGTVSAPSNRKVGPNDPASLGRIIAIAKFFRRKNLMAETDPTWLATFQRLAVFDGETGYWVPPQGFTQGEAEALQSRLYDLPWKGKSQPAATKVTRSTATPLPKTAPVTDEAIAARAEAAEAASKASGTEPVGDRIGRLEAVVLRLAEAIHGRNVPAEPEAAPVTNLVPEGYEVRVGKKGPYLAKAK